MHVSVIAIRTLKYQPLYNYAEYRSFKMYSFKKEMFSLLESKSITHLKKKKLCEEILPNLLEGLHV